MAKLVFGMNQSLDGYVDHLEMRTGPALFRHWIEHVRDLTGSVYGRRMYEVMRYWDEDRPEWSAEQHEFAAAWRRQPKWVVSRSLKLLGPNATPTLVLLMSIDSTSTPSCLVAASHSLPARGRRSALFPPIPLARTRLG
jgi:hypothetical protein